MTKHESMNCEWGISGTNCKCSVDKELVYWWHSSIISVKFEVIIVWMRTFSQTKECMYMLGNTSGVYLFVHVCKYTG